MKEIPCDESLIEYIKLARCKGKNVIGTTIPYLVSREEIKKILDTI